MSLCKDMMPTWELRTAMESAEAKVTEQAARIAQLEAALDTVRASGLLIGSTTLHDRVRSAVYNAIDANPAALEEAPCSSS